MLHDINFVFKISIAPCLSQRFDRACKLTVRLLHTVLCACRISGNYICTECRTVQDFFHFSAVTLEKFFNKFHHDLQLFHAYTDHRQCVLQRTQKNGKIYCVDLQSTQSMCKFTRFLSTLWAEHMQMYWRLSVLVVEFPYTQTWQICLFFRSFSRLSAIHCKICRTKLVLLCRICVLRKYHTGTVTAGIRLGPLFGHFVHDYMDFAELVF